MVHATTTYTPRKWLKTVILASPNQDNNQDYNHVIINQAIYHFHYFALFLKKWID